jgi:hemoglobin/transferrin/lactoferrin receptor protein
MLFMRRIASLFIYLSLLYTAWGQDNTDTVKVKQLDEVVISASKFAEKKKNIAQKIDVIGARTIAAFNAQNTGDLLINTGNVFVQKSQQGGSSPVIRGFEASRVLLVIDGVRLNNAIYRSGHLQNAITVDQNMLERVEVMYGPASTLYGSDALGGVIHFRTKTPKLSGDKNSLVTGSGFARYSSVNDEKTVHANASIGGKKFAWLQAYTFSSFGDMKMGNNYPDKYPDFGRRKEYISTINGVDSIIKNSDDRIQRFSGYKQWDITQKFLFKPNKKTLHLLNLQVSNSTDIPRYDRLQDIRNGALRFAEWYYGPQKRLMGSYEFSIANTGFFNEIRTNLNYQDIEESRQTRDYRRYDRFDSRRENIKVWGIIVDGRKVWGQNELTVGMDAQLNDLTSVADRRNIITGATTPLDTRYPDGKNKMNYYAAYAQHIYKFLDGKLVLNDGLRLQLVTLRSSIVNNSFFNLPFTNIEQENSAVTGNLGLSYLPQKNTKLSISFASGFRTPNIDDLAKIFESSTSARQVVFPNPDIKPEYTYNVDLGIVHSFAERISVELTGFYTLFRNAIVKAPFTINGQDSIEYNGVKSQVLASQNRNKAYLYGFNAAVSIAITSSLNLTSTINYTRGRFDTDASKPSAVYQKQPNGSYQLVQANVSSKPLDHIPPLFGKTSLLFTQKTWNLELFSLYNGWKRLKDYNADGEDNAQYATADGMPSWFTLNVRAAHSFFNQRLHLQFAIENILDRNYRYFASGFSAPGRNFIVAIRTNF